METVNAKKWFDQLKDVPQPEAFKEDLWCWRHWAPCPVLGGNGLIATMLVMKFYIDNIKPTNLVAHNAINRHMHSVGKLCCTIGDDGMYDIWGQAPPAKPGETSEQSRVGNETSPDKENDREEEGNTAQ